MLVIMCSTDPRPSHFLESSLQIKYLFKFGLSLMQKEKALKTGINQAARCSEQMGFPTPLGHLTQAVWAAHGASRSHSSLPSPGMRLWEYGISFETFWLCFFKCAVPIAQPVLIFIGKDMIGPPSTGLLF